MSCQQVPTAPAFNPYPRSVQVGEFEVAIGGGIWVAIREWGEAPAPHGQRDTPLALSLSEWLGLNLCCAKALSSR